MVFNRKSKIQNRKSAGIAALVITLVISGAAARAQQPTKVHRIGLLAGGSTARALSPRFLAFRQALQDLGYFEGKNVVFDHRSAEGKLERLPELAADLVRLKVDVIVATGDGPISAARQETKTIPIVMVVSNDPVGLGHVASLARPDGNVTGLTTISADLAGKRVELIKEIIPKASRIAVLRDPRNPGTAAHLREIEIAAQGFSLRIRSFDLQSPAEFESTFRAVAKDRADALIIVTGAFFSIHRKQLLDSVAKLRLPAVYPDEEYIADGGLIAYSTSVLEQHRRAAKYVDKILKGAKPAELPVEQPMKFDLIINLKAAKQIGLTIPPNVLARADRVIK